MIFGITIYCRLFVFGAPLVYWLAYLIQNIFLVKMDYGPTHVIHNTLIRENPQKIYKAGDRCEMINHGWHNFFPGKIDAIGSDFTVDVIMDDGKLYKNLRI